MKEKVLKEIIKDVERLKERNRQGWEVRGLPSESIAEHLYGTCFFTLLLTELIKEDIDTEKALKYAIVHDFSEAKISDLDKLAQKYLNKEKAEEIIIGETNNFLSELLHGFKSNNIESKVVKDADKLDMVSRAIKLKKLGYSEDVLDEFTKNNDFNFEESKEINKLLESY